MYECDVVIPQYSRPAISDSNEKIIVVICTHTAEAEILDQETKTCTCTCIIQDMHDTCPGNDGGELSTLILLVGSFDL